MTDNRKIKLYLILMYALFILFLSGYTFLYVRHTNETYAENYVGENQEIYTNNLNDLINQEKALLDSGTTDGVIINNTITYEGSNYVLDDLILNDYNLAIGSNYLFVIKELNFKAINLNDLIKTATLNTNADDLIIMNKEGYIYYFNNSGASANLNGYLDANSSQYINEYFSQNKSGVIKASRNDEAIYLSFMPLADYNDLYFMQIYIASNINLSHLNNNLGLILGIIIYSILIIVVQVYIFRTVHIKNAEIEANRLNFYYTKPFIMELNKEGKIKKYNNRMKSEVNDLKEYKHINDLKTNNLEHQNQVFNLIIKEEPLTIEFSNKIIRFITTKTKNGYYLVGEDITNTETNIEEMKTLAYFDQLSKKPNLHYLKKVLEAHFASDSFKENKTAAVILDIIGFTVIKNVFGRENGYISLSIIATVISDIASKYEGLTFNTEEDKFVVLFKNIKTKETVIDFMNEVYLEVAKPITVSENIINAQLNGAIYYYDTNLEQELTLKYLYDALLAALIKSKETANPTYTIFDETIRLYISEEKTMLKDLINAIEKDEIDVYLQPQYSNKEKRIVGFEALARWNNPKYIKRSPQQFILLAEKNNLIIRIGQIIMRKTFELAKKLSKYNVTISFNVSPVEVLQEGFVERFLNEYKKYNLKKGSIALEVTETFLITSLKDVNDKFRVLKEEGLEIHLDDFGTEYSSLLYLRDLAVDTIKIDREFIRHLETDKKDRAIVKMLINLISALDYNIIAEGVETEYQNNFLYRQGADIIQGYLISPAVPYEEVLKLLEEYKVKKTKTIKVPERKRGIKL